MNRNRGEVATKVRVLNSLYWGGLRSIDIEPLSKYIATHGRELDGLLASRDYTAIDLMVGAKGKWSAGRRIESEFFVFATKYCHWHLPRVFPILDSYSSIALRRLHFAMGLRPQPSDSELRDGSKGVTLLRDASVRLKRTLGLAGPEWSGMKPIDEALWILGQAIDSREHPGEYNAIDRYEVASLLPREILLEPHGNVPIGWGSKNRR